MLPVQKGSVQQGHDNAIITSHYCLAVILHCRNIGLGQLSLSLSPLHQAA